MSGVFAEASYILVGKGQYRMVRHEMLQTKLHDVLLIRHTGNDE